ncbi:MAG: 30S ribosomal protein S7 [Gammaproteobacteria bacterium]|nr:30S ribosomal protein S7 [Gammaproteobacteria bacterium]
MSRRREAEKREILPDPKYHNTVLAKFINMVMRSGKKSIAEKIVYGALDQIDNRKKTENSLEVFIQALDNVKPVVEVKSRRVGGATYQIPIEVRAERSITLAMRWLVDAAKNRGEKSMGLRLAGEILDASDNKGTAIKKREDTHKMAEANKAFSHYRW